LKENIRFLYRMLRDLESRGFDTVVVGKAFYDDHMHGLRVENLVKK